MLGFFYAYMDVGKGREQERKLCPGMDCISRGAKDGGANMYRMSLCQEWQKATMHMDEISHRKPVTTETTNTQ